MNVIVTGATGFLGTALVKELLDNQVNVTVLTRKNKNNLDRRAKLVYCPLEEMKNVDVSSTSAGVFDIFFHFGWDGTSGATRGDFALQLKNAEYSCDALQLASKLGCRTFVNAGSISAYEAMATMKKDDSKPGLGNIYATAKLTADLMAKTLASNLGISYINVLISNIYGIGEHSQRFLNATLRKLLRNETIPLTHGDQLYDFIYISDAVQAICLSAKLGKSHENYYIGNTEQKPLRQFVVEMKQIVGSKSQLEFGLIEQTGPSLTYDEFDTAKVKNEFGFLPQVSFKDGITRTKNWILEDVNEQPL